jgi:hypothetical protein
MTRKSGVLSDFSFKVFVKSDDFSTTYLDKTYTFSNFGTILKTENIYLPSLPGNNRAWLIFSFTGNFVGYSSPVGAGITQVRF